MGPLISAGSSATPCSGYVDDVEVAFTGSGARRGRGFWLPPTVVLSDDPAEPDLARGGVRAGRRGDAVRRRGRGGRAGQRHASTGCRARSSPATSAGRCGSRAGSRPATSASTRTRRCATGRRSAASSSPASAASSARTRRTRSPRRRTSSSPRLSSAVDDRSPATARHDHRKDQHGRTPRRQGRRGHRRVLGHRPGDRAPLRRGGRARSSSATSTTSAGRGSSAELGRRDVRARRRHRQGPGRRAVRARRRTPTARSTSRSTTPASPRRRTTRSSTPTSTPGGGCRRST